MMSAGSGQKRRLFTGLSLTPEVRDYVSGVVVELSREVPDVRWVPTENFHVTLKFLGVCDEDQVEDLVAAMRKASRHLPLELTIGGVGAFPSSGSARVIWVGATDLEDRVEKVYNVLEKGAEKCGFPREKRRYTPHITVGRSRKQPVSLPRGLLERFTEKLPLEVRDIVLFESVLRSSGAEYSVLEKVGQPR